MTITVIVIIIPVIIDIIIIIVYRAMAVVVLSALTKQVGGDLIAQAGGLAYLPGFSMLMRNPTRAMSSSFSSLFWISAY